MTRLLWLLVQPFLIQEGNISTCVMNVNACLIIIFEVKLILRLSLEYNACIDCHTGVIMFLVIIFRDKF